MPNDGPNAFIKNAEMNGRLTMRDVILVRVGSGVKVKNAKGGNFENLLVVSVANVVDVPVHARLDPARRDREEEDQEGKTRASDQEEASASSTRTSRRSTTRLRCRAFVRSRRKSSWTSPANHPRAIILGDFNSDSPGVKPGDEQAYDVLLAGGFEERSTDDPLSCCVSDLFTAAPDQFDHQVDHVMTNMGDQAILKTSLVTGLTQTGGIYPSDHAGVFSTLKLK